MPEGWARTPSGKGTAFTDKLNRIEIAAGTAPRAGRGVLLVTHSAAVVKVADRVIALRDGRIQP
ncbi:hypothetical protein [Streptomyces sp. H27-D2]|uniref:hypothetical protein n=1 Tax=Streptomyces sp. H27-D2 TaxID=3046304 RepID=UPI002DB606D3|nr:hypothetical protein [Streptomyces sp. H27-D2]MEC4015384.1 hypothetical protein [Streptomyces sp. H27-D2]